MADKVKIQRIKRELQRMQTQGRPSRRNINLKLLLLIIILISAIIIATFLFRWQYSDLSTQHKQKLNELLAARDQLDGAMKKVREKENELDEILGSLNISQARESALGERYINLTNIKERVETDLQNTQTTLAMCKGTLETKVNELNDALNDLDYYIDLYNKKLKEYQDLQLDYKSTRSRISDLNKTIGQLNGFIDDVRGCLVSHNSTYCLNRHF
ncbi:MAG: hypothetical protein JXB14_08440 [Candidatus Altiarchaeota archaeon]|nr:hypothetical protein [Candidatus Altiarchaeota archaeon]